MGVFWAVIIGFAAAIIARFLHGGHNEPSDFMLKAMLGVGGALVGTFLGQVLIWYRPGEEAGLVGAVAGAVIVLLIWDLVDPGGSRV
jgi:uncharacterized membrane protein YeaQ/YmgE (transglycosylase-associated protein family)